MSAKIIFSTRNKKKKSLTFASLQSLSFHVYSKYTMISGTSIERDKHDKEQNRDIGYKQKAICAEK